MLRELLIVLLIIVLIVHISLPMLMNAREQARMAALIADSHEERMKTDFGPPWRATSWKDASWS